MDPQEVLRELRSIEEKYKQEVLRELRSIEKKYKSDNVYTFEVRLADMARDAADAIEILIAQVKLLQFKILMYRQDKIED